VKELLDLLAVRPNGYNVVSVFALNENGAPPNGLGKTNALRLNRLTAHSVFHSRESQPFDIPASREWELLSPFESDSARLFHSHITGMKKFLPL
jgi:hypothetical protein